MWNTNYIYSLISIVFISRIIKIVHIKFLPQLFVLIDSALLFSIYLGIVLYIQEPDTYSFTQVFICPFLPFAQKRYGIRLVVPLQDFPC